MSVEPAPGRLFDQPELSRQWVVRRLQRALTLDLAAASLQHGIAATAGDDGGQIRASAASASERAERIREMILDLGSAPYSSLGIGRAAAGLGGRVLGLFGRWAWRPATLRLGEHTLSEYDLLRAYVEDAPGVPEGLADEVVPLLDSARTRFGELAAKMKR